MTHTNKRAFAAAIAIAAVFVGTAGAKCGPQTQNNPIALAHVRPLVLKTTPMVTRPADGTPAVEPSIAGLWSMQIVADGQVVDEGFDMWHPDGTELLNDTSTPSSGAVCIGIWTKTAPYTYQLKHPSYIFDDANVNLIGLVIIRETITLDPSGNSYTGTLATDAYDLMGNSLGHQEAELRALRIAVVDDPKQTTGIPGLPVFDNNN